MAGVLESQDDDFQVLVGNGALNLCSEEVGSAKEEVTFDVDNRDRGNLTFALFAHFAQIAIIAHLILNKVRLGCFAKEECDREADSYEDRVIKACK